MPDYPFNPNAPSVVEVYEPVSKRFLFRLDTKTMMVEVRHRNSRTAVDIAGLAKNPKDAAAVFTTSLLKP